MQSLRDTDPAAFAQYMRAKYGEDDARLAAAAPGPWAVTQRSVGKRQATVVLDADRNEVCEAYDSAALIAAAPDLLAALQALAAVCENEGFPYLGNVLPKARAAIARATGEA